MQRTGQDRLALLVVLVLATVVALGLVTGCSDSGDKTPTTASPVGKTETATSPAGSFAGKTLVLATDVLVDGPRDAEGTSTVVGDVTEVRGIVVTGKQTATDERLSGQYVAELNADGREGSGARMWGIHELTNEGGSWKGTWYGADSGGAIYAKSVLNGSGEYDGLEAHLQMHTTDAEDPFPGAEHVWTGWIQKAD